MHTRYNRIATLLLIVCLGVSVFGAPRSAHAITVNIASDISTTGLINTAKNTISAVSSGIQAAAQSSLIFKEFTLYSISWNIGKQIL